MRMPLSNIVRKPKASAPARRGKVPAKPTVSAMYSAGYMTQPYAFGSAPTSSHFTNWNPALRETQDDVSASWTKAAARATDMIQNSGWIAGGIDQALAHIMGGGLRLNVQIDTTLIDFGGLVAPNGETVDAAGWARFVERRFETYSKNRRRCSYDERMNLAQQARAILHSFFATGEGIALLPYVDEGDERPGTRSIVIPSHRLSQKNDSIEKVRQGIKLDNRGRAIAYVFDQKLNALEPEKIIAARDGAGRPQVVHLFDPKAGQIRGITPMVPALKVCKQYDQLSDGTLAAALIQAIFAATVESERPTPEFLNSLREGADTQGLGTGSVDDFMEARGGWYDSTDINLGDPGKLAHLFPGEKLTFNRSEHPNSTYGEFVRFLLREIAKCLGITYEQLTGDYTDATYSSVRMAIAEVWPICLWRREHIVAPFYQSVYEAWLEEEIEAGVIAFPGGLAGFLENREEAVRALWAGPPMPQADEIKAAKTIEVYRKMGLISDADACQTLGKDHEDVYEQRAREQQMRDRLKLRDNGPSTEFDLGELQADTAKAGIDAKAEADAAAAEEDDDPEDEGGFPGDRVKEEAV